MLSLAASSSVGFTALGEHWDVYAAAAAKAGHAVHRDSWRVVVNMHIADTREQALADLEWGIMDNVHYTRSLRGLVPGDGTTMSQLSDAKDAVRMLTTEGMGIFGVAMAGTPDDAIQHIERLLTRSGGFGTLLFMGHNFADSAATRRSYELFARYVLPHFSGATAPMQASREWCHERSSLTFGNYVTAMQQAISAYTPP